ncbi:MAG TPA: restriction endonuclease subunit S [Clostridiales bacterium]|nr:restriction endonuclease subunit S [Clostridiales bacterium]
MKVKLSDVCEKASSNLKQSDVEGKTGAYPIYGAAGYIGNVDFYQQKKPCVAVVKDGAGIGRTMLLPANSSVIGTMQYLLPKDNILPEYLCYVVRYMHLEKYFSGATIPHIYFRDYKNEEFNLVDIEQQKEIVSVLSKVEGIISKRQQQLQLLDEFMKLQFIEMFGDPVLNSKRLPIKTLPEIGENLDSQRIPITSGNRKQGIYPYYGASGVVDYVDDYIFDEDILLISEDGANLLARVTPIAFSATGKVWVNNHAHVMRFSSMATQVYVERFLNMIDISTYVTGTAQPKLNQAKLNSIPIPFPSEQLMQDYMEIIEQSDKSKFAIRQSIEKLETLKQALMQKYFG